MAVDESTADDGAMHRFWAFILLRIAAGLPADTSDALKLLLLIVIFDSVADTIPEHPS